VAQTAEVDLLPKQDEAWSFIFDDPTITEVGYGGAAGGGKTRLGWYVALFGYCEAYKGARFAVGRKELKTLRLTTLAELFVIFQELGYRKDIDYTFNAQDNILKFPNGSEIILLDLAYSPQDPEYTRFGSLNLTGAWAEESNESPEKAIQILKTRVGRQNKLKGPDGIVDVKPIWLETFNPNKGHVHRTYYKPWKEGQLPSYRAFVRALPGDNPHLPKAYIENLQRADKTTRERLLFGNFDYDADPMKIMAYDAIMDLRTNVLPDLPYGTTPQKYLITDVARFGGDKIVMGEFEDYCLVGLTVHKFRGLDETEQDIRDQAAESRIPYSNILSDDDGVGGSIADHLKGTKGFNGGSRPRTIHDDFTGKDVAENYSNLRSQCYFRLAELVNPHLFAIRLRYFKTNIEGYTEEQAMADLEEELDAIKRVAPKGGQNEKLAIIPKSEIKEALGRSPDFADVLMMRMFFELRPVPARTYPVVIQSKRKTVINRAK
jgi:hypothetical protein